MCAEPLSAVASNGSGLGNLRLLAFLVPAARLAHPDSRDYRITHMDV